MSTSQRVGRGVHRLGLLLSIIVMLVGGGLGLYIAKGQADAAGQKHQRLRCAHNVIEQTKKSIANRNDTSVDVMLVLRFLYSPDDEELSLRDLNCSRGHLIP